MRQQLEEEAELRRYLLGELAPEERVAVEARLFLDDEYLSQLRAVEDELIDDYAFDELPPGERGKLEAANLLSEPDRREDLMVSRALKRYLSHEGEVVTPAVVPDAEPESEPDSDEPPTPPGGGSLSFLASLFLRRPGLGFALGAVALVVLSLVVWLSFDSLRRQGQPSPIQAREEPTPRPSVPAEREQPAPGGELQANERRPDTGGEVKDKEEQAGQRDAPPRGSPPPSPQTQTRVATFLVLPGGVVKGEGESEKVTLTPDVGTVVLRLPLVVAPDHGSYRATLQAGQQVVYEKAGLKPEADAEMDSVVRFRIPARLLRARRYQIKLGGVNASGQTVDLRTYTFEVERQ